MVKILEIGSLCTGCMACYSVCPSEAISMQEDNDGFYVPTIDTQRCTECQLCEKVCPEIDTGNRVKRELIQKSYYGWHNDDSIRKRSSSGGAFSALAGKIMEEEGIVFGAVYDNNLRMLVHKSTEDVDLNEMRKSKYVQSYIGESFRQVKSVLSQGRKVLFVGTPCQIAGLNNYIGLYDELITCDFICHGVPAMRTLNDDLNLVEKKYKDEVVGFDFRPKVRTWAYDYFSVFLKRKGRKDIPWSYDSFFKGFIDNLILRKSCYRCHYAAEQHEADITIADFWGYRRYKEELFDNRGLSLMIANTDRGDEFLKSIDKELLTLNPIDWQYASYVFAERTQHNYDINGRNAFFEYYNRHGYLKAVRKFSLVPTSKKKMLQIGNKIIKRMKAMYK